MFLPVTDKASTQCPRGMGRAEFWRIGMVRDVSLGRGQMGVKSSETQHCALGRAGSKADLNKSNNNYSHDHGLALGEGARQGSRVGDRAIWGDLGEGSLLPPLRSWELSGMGGGWAC